MRSPLAHEFVLDLSEFKKHTGVSALDVAKSLIDYGMHPPTMYFPMIVHDWVRADRTVFLQISLSAWGNFCTYLKISAVPN